MPKQYKTPKSKNQVAAGKKIIAAAQKEYRRDLSEKWKVLKKIGAYNAKAAVAQKNLTASRIREIEKKFKEVQSMKKFIGRKVVRPLELVEKKTKRGSRLVYDFTPNFTFVKSKRKPKLEQGLMKTLKGFITEKRTDTEKVQVNRRGEIIETRKGVKRVKKIYKGRDLVKLIKDIENGAIKFTDKQLLVLHRWGQPASYFSSPGDMAIEMAKYMQEIKSSMSPDMFDKFTEATYIEIVKWGG